MAERLNVAASAQAGFTNLNPSGVPDTP